MAQQPPKKPPKIGYSYPSKQVRYGPAPLASFEDLPSEDLVSLNEDLNDFDLNADEDALNEALDAADSRGLLQKGNEETVSPCPTLTPVDEDANNASRRCSGVSQNTLTAGSPSEEQLKVHRLSATTNAEPGSGSQFALGPGPGSGPEADAKQQRKGSWTDIFFRGRSRSRSPIEIETESGGGGKVKEDTTSTKKKKKKGVLSIFSSNSDGNRGRKCKSPARSKNTPSPSHLVTNDQLITTNTGPCKEIPKLSVTTATIEVISCTSLDDDFSNPHSPQPRPTSTSTTTNTATPDASSPSPPLEQMCRQQMHHSHHDQVNDLQDVQEAPSMEQRQAREGECHVEREQEEQLHAKGVTQVPTIRRKLKKRSDSEISECQSLPEILPSTRKPSEKPTGESIVAPTVEEGLLSRTESEQTITDAEDSSAFPPRVEVEDECEIAGLIAADSIDADDTSLCQYNVKLLNANTSVQIASKEQRAQELSSLIAVNRPRSTTPVSIAPLEEYLRKASLSPDSGAASAIMEKIKLVLPGDQFASCSRSKIPRKSNPQIWLDFCEKSFSTSPNIRKKFMHWPSSEATSPYKDAESNGSSALKIDDRGPNLTATSALSPNDAFTPVTDTPLTPVTPLDDKDLFDFGDSFDPSSFLREKGLVIPSECNRCMCKLKNDTCELIADSSPTSSNEDADSPLLEAFADPLLQENQVLLPPKATTSNVDYPLSSEAVLGDDDEQEDEPLISRNSCQCSCHTASRRNTIATLVNTQSKGHTCTENTIGNSSNWPRKQDSVVSCSSDISSASSHLANSSSSGKLSLDDCPIRVDSENPKTV